MLAYFPDKRKKQNHLLEYSLFLWIIFLHFTQQVTVESGHCSTKVTVKQGEGLEVIFDIKLNGFSRMEEAGSEHVGHKGSYFISWVEQSSSARKCSWKNFSTRGGQSITQLNVQIPWRIHNWKNHWPGKQFRIPRLTELLWHKQMQDSNLLRRDNKQSIYLFISVICVTTFHWSSTISGIYLTRQLIFFLAHFEFHYFSRDIQEGKNLKNTSHQQLRILQDGRGAAWEENGHCANTFQLSLQAKDHF